MKVLFSNSPSCSAKSFLSPEANQHGRGCGPSTLSALSCLAGAQSIISKGLICSLVWKLQRKEQLRELILDPLAPACRRMQERVWHLLPMRKVRTGEALMMILTPSGH